MNFKQLNVSDTPNVPRAYATRQSSVKLHLAVSTTPSAHLASFYIASSLSRD